MDQIVGKQEQLQKGHVGHPLLGGNFVQREITEQLADGSLHVGARLISFPNPPRLHSQIGHKGRIGVPTNLQQGQLLDLLRVFRQGPSHHDKPMLLFPSPRLKTKFRYRPTEGHFLEAGFVGQRQVGFRLAANNNIAAACLVQITDQLSRKKSRIGQQPNPRPRHLRWDLLQTARDQSAGSGVGGRISGAQRSVPKLLAVSFKAQNRMIGRPPHFLWVVTQARPLLLAIERENHRVQVENQARAPIRKAEQLCPHWIMQLGNLPDGFGREAAQKAAQRGLVGKPLQSNQRTKQSVVLKDLGFIDAWKASDQNIEKHQNEIRWMIVDPAGSASENTFQSAAQTQLVTKTLDKEQTSEVSKRVSFE